MARARLRTRKIVTATHRSTRFHSRHCLFFMGALLMMVVPLIRKDLFFIEKRALHEYLLMFDRMTSPIQFSSNNVSNTDNVGNYRNHPSSFQELPNDDATSTKKIKPINSVFRASENSERLDPDDKTENSHFNKNLNKTETELPAVLHFPAFSDDGVEMKWELEGLSVSKAIHLINDINASMLYPNIAWMGSPIPNRLCNMEWVKQAMEFYHTQTGKNIKSDWTFHLMDWSDHPYHLLRCEKLEELVGKEKIHYWKRSIVTGRYWNATTKSVELGQIATEIDGVKVSPLYHSTRTDIVQDIAATAARQTNRTMMSAKELTEYLVTKERPRNVVHHWRPFGGRVNRGSDKVRTDLLRTTTSLTLRRMRLPPYNLTGLLTGIFGVGMDKGRFSTNEGYIDSLFQYKIILVSQRDMYEGHFRLFEGLASGALVIHDRIVSMPVGLEENVSIVFFDSQDELMTKVMYYLSHPEERLAIARRGRQVAMCQSRPWHRMEQIIFGRSVTPCDE